MAASLTETCVIRKARPEDCENIATLIKELACHLNSPGLGLDADTLRKDGFGEEKIFHCLVLEDTSTKNLVGHALYTLSYSTWSGVNIYLVELFVSGEYRKHGLGKRLWREVAKIAVERGYKSVNLQCLDWNKEAIEFYKSQGARNRTEKEGWIIFRLDGDSLKAVADE